MLYILSSHEQVTNLFAFCSQASVTPSSKVDSFLHLQILVYNLPQSINSIETEEDAVLIRDLVNSI